MRPTRRGYGALAVIGTAIGLAWLAGPRALNAIAAPVLVALLVGAVQVYRAGEPTIERTRPRRGFPGDRRTITLSVEGGAVARIRDHLPAGVVGEARAERALPATVEYEVRYAERGAHPIGPATVRITDALGLVGTRYEVESVTEALVYPRIHSVGDPVGFLRAMGPESDDRTEFDRLREYVPGDRLRDVHWKSTAKHDDLLVTEFTDPTDEETVVIAAEGDPGTADEMATAAATLLVAAVRTGLSVRLITPDGEVGAGFGETHQRQALELLARTGAGELAPADREAAAIHVAATADGVDVTILDTHHDIDDIRTTRENPLRGEVAA